MTTQEQLDRTTADNREPVDLYRLCYELAGILTAARARAAKLRTHKRGTFARLQAADVLRAARAAYIAADEAADLAADDVPEHVAMAAAANLAGDQAAAARGALEAAERAAAAAWTAARRAAMAAGDNASADYALTNARRHWAAADRVARS